MLLNVFVALFLVPVLYTWMTPGGGDANGIEGLRISIASPPLHLVEITGAIALLPPAQMREECQIPGMRKRLR